jgi:hypothetical protein
MKVDFFDLLVAVPPHNMLAITQRNDWEKLTHNPLAQQFVALKSKKHRTSDGLFGAFSNATRTKPYLIHY